MKYSIPAIIALTLICGCATIPEPDRQVIETAFQQVNIVDGISMEEAITISQRFMLSRYYDTDWYVSKPKEVKLDTDGKEWSVDFKPKNDGWGNGPRRGSKLTLELLMPKMIYIDVKDGSISMMTMVEQNGKVVFSKEKQ